jgi:O-antigen ligase
MAVILITLLLTPASYWERQRTVTDTSDSSISRRIDYIVVARDAFLENPLLGAGPGTFMDFWGEAVVAGKVEKGTSRNYRRPAHNTYLEVLVGSGMLGLVFYMAVIFLALRAFFSAQRKFSLQGCEGDASLVGAFKISFFSILLYFLILSAFYHKFFWISLAFSQLALQYANGREDAFCRS